MRTWRMNRLSKSSESFSLNKVRTMQNWTRTLFALGLFTAILSVSGCALTSGANAPASASDLVINTPSLPQGQLNSDYNASLTASGGKEPYTWSVMSGALPGGLSLTPSSGRISGTPTQSGASTFTIGVQDAASPIATARAPMTINIAGSSSPLQISTTGLPSGTVRASYAATLSASGGTAPYRWSVSSGQLPTGLTLKSSGAISGVPTTGGQESFVVQVADSSSPTKTAKAAMAISISNSSGLSTLQISTTGLPSGTVRASYAATLSASGGTAPYTWSVSSGQLPTGLTLKSSGAITGVPTTAGQASFEVQVADSSSPAATAKASMAISIANTSTVTSLQISSAALPTGIDQISYAANLSASGGTSPYTWSIISGALPAGLTLSSSGSITGVPSTTGQASFTVEAMDSSSPRQTATQSFAITISPQSATIGPYTSRTDFNLIPLPIPLPSVGGATGAGRCITQPGYNNLVCRATDIDTLGVGSHVLSQEFSNCCGGWADINVWNTNSTMLFLETNGGATVAMSFNPSTHAIAPLYGQVLPSISGGWWSHSNPNLAYALQSGTKDPVIVSMTFSSQTTPPQPVVIADLATIPNCVPALAGTTVWEDLSVSRDEQTFLVGAGTGTQNSAIYAIVYNRTNGCRWYNTQTGQIGGNWGPIGQAATSATYTMHGLRLSADGQTALLGPATVSGITYERHFWNIASLQVDSANDNVNNGHYALGYSGIVNNANYTADGVWCKYGMAYRTFADLLNPTYVIPTVAQCGDTEIFGDDHSSWNDDDTSDDQPFFTSTLTVPYGTPITTAWQDEILGFSVTNPGTVWRFLSTYNTGTSQFFTCQQGIGTVSQDGKWFAFTSDWGNTLGLDGAGNNRCDVFIGQLK
jgi:hypothetical protein